MCEVIVSIDAKGNISNKNELPIFCVENEQRFKLISLAKNEVIIGRKTFDLIKSSLQDRDLYVATRNKNLFISKEYITYITKNNFGILEGISSDYLVAGGKELIHSYKKETTKIYLTTFKETLYDKNPVHLDLDLSKFKRVYYQESTTIGKLDHKFEIFKRIDNE